MSLFRLISVVFLAFAFGVLVWTFVWVAKLLARREAEAAAAAAVAGAERVDAAVAPEPEAESEAAEDPEAEDAADLERRKVGTGVNATLGLLLSILACLLFWLSPFVMILSAGGIYFSANALYLGLRLFRVFIPRAAIGLVLGLASVVAFFAHRVGQFDGILPP